MRHEKRLLVALTGVVLAAALIGPGRAQAQPPSAWAIVQALQAHAQHLYTAEGTAVQSSDAHTALHIQRLEAYASLAVAIQAYTDQIIPDHSSPDFLKAELDLGNVQVLAGEYAAAKATFNSCLHSPVSGLQAKSLATHQLAKIASYQDEDARTIIHAFITEILAESLSTASQRLKHFTNKRNATDGGPSERTETHSPP